MVDIVLVEAVLLRQMRHCLQHLPGLSLQRGQKVVGSYMGYILLSLIISLARRSLRSCTARLTGVTDSSPKLLVCLAVGLL